MPIREKTSLINRYQTKKVGTIEPFKTYYLIMEGTNTEPIYFRLLEKKFISMKVRNHVRIVYLERTENDVGSNSPRQLLSFLLKFKQTKNDGVFAMIFDRDSFKNHPNPIQSYHDFIKKALKLPIKLVVSSPCFETWLLLHYPNVVKDYLIKNEQLLMDNPRVSSTFTYASKLVDKLFGFNPKAFIPEDFIDNLPIAMKQRYELTTDVRLMATQLGETVGDLIKELQYDPRKLT
ncbi:MAG: RloB family protein [Bacilli bacterium]